MSASSVLLLIALLADTAPLTTALLDLSGGLQAELRDKTQEAFAHLPLFVSFLRSAADLLGIARVPDAPPLPADAATLPADVAKQMIATAESAFDTVCRALHAGHRAVRGKERENQRTHHAPYYAHAYAYACVDCVRVSVFV